MLFPFDLKGLNLVILHLHFHQTLHSRTLIVALWDSTWPERGKAKH